jgi:hypothetical protein
VGRDWVTGYGATVQLFIDDPNGDHGGFMLNAANVESALASHVAELAKVANVVSNAEADCLPSSGEERHPALLAPRRTASKIQAPYYYRNYAATESYVGVSTADHHHLYYLGAGGTLADLGQRLRGWRARGVSEAARSPRVQSSVHPNNGESWGYVKTGAAKRR